MLRLLDSSPSLNLHNSFTLFTSLNVIIHEQIGTPQVATLPVFKVSAFHPFWPKTD